MGVSHRGELRKKKEEDERRDIIHAVTEGRKERGCGRYINSSGELGRKRRKRQGMSLI